MTDISKTTGYEHLISLNKFDTSSQRMMARVYAMVGKERQNLSLPLLIGIDVDYNKQDNASFILRNFLYQLRKVHQNHFVRFVTDTLWAMESDNGHLFYTHDGPKDHRCDVIWKVKAVGAEQVEVWVSQAGNASRAALLSDTSIKLKRFVSGAGEEASVKDLCHLLHRFYGRLGQLHHIKMLEEDFHTILISSSTNKGYYSLPLYGMSYFDAIRKFHYIKGQMEYTRRCHYDTLPDQLSIDDVFETTLKLVQDNGNFGVSRTTAHDTYNLVEQLFAIFAGTQSTRRSSHDVILFNEHHQPSKVIDIYRASMADIEDNLNS